MELLEVNSKTFDDEVVNSDVPVVVDFWAPWCGPCKMMEPILKEAADEIGSEGKVVKVNIDDCADVASRYSIISIPTLLYFKDGKVMTQHVGIQNKTVVINEFGKLAGMGG